MAVDFEFRRLVTPTPGPVDLEFGDGGSAPSVFTATLTAALPSATAALGLVPALVAQEVPAEGVKIPATLAAAVPAVVVPALAVAAAAHQARPAALLASLPVPALPALSPAAQARQDYAATLSAALPAVALQTLGFASAADYDLALHSGVSIPCQAPHSRAAPRTAGLIAPTQTAKAHVRPLRADYRATARRSHGVRLPVQQQTPRHRAACLPAYRRAGVGQGLAMGQYQRPTAHRAAHLPSFDTQQHTKGLALGQFDLARLLRPLHLLQTEAPPISAGVVLHLRAGRLISIRRCLPIYPLGWPAPGQSPRPPVPVDPADALVRLVFVRPQDSTNDLIFNYQPTPRPDRPVVVPVLEYYNVLSTHSLVFAETGQPIPCTGITADLSADGWTWSWSAEGIPAGYMPALRGEHGDYVEVLATWNGVTLRLCVERITRTRQHPTATLSMGGRGRAAALADPSSPTQTYTNALDRTAQQLMADALQINGVPLGWDVDWQITDWLVPAGAWSHTGTIQSAINRIAEAGGAYVQPHNTDDTLIVLPWYPLPPWLWHTLTADIELPEDVCEVEGLEQVDRPVYDSVWIIGSERGGRADNVVRTGTAAAKVAPTIVDPLATSSDMTRQRGRRAISDTGRQEHITLTLPVLAETGIIKPGAVIDYTEQGTTHRGIVRRVGVKSTPVVQQTLTLETHVESTV